MQSGHVFDCWHGVMTSTDFGIIIKSTVSDYNRQRSGYGVMQRQLYVRWRVLFPCVVQLYSVSWLRRGRTR